MMINSDSGKEEQLSLMHMGTSLGKKLHHAHSAHAPSDLIEEICILGGREEVRRLPALVHGLEKWNDLERARGEQMCRVSSSGPQPKDAPTCWFT